MRRFRLAGQVINETDSGLQSILANAYDLRIRPLCLCREPGLAMYIARVGTQYVVKRMPLSGSGHDPQCPSYEAPDELSGLGVLMGSAIQVEIDVVLTVDLDEKLHDREIRIDNGWVVKIGRGLDFYQKPDGWFAVGANDFSLRRCLETKVDIFRMLAQAERVAS